MYPDPDETIYAVEFKETKTKLYFRQPEKRSQFVRDNPQIKDDILLSSFKVRVVKSAPKQLHKTKLR